MSEVVIPTDEKLADKQVAEINPKTGRYDEREVRDKELAALKEQRDRTLDELEGIVVKKIASSDGDAAVV